MTIPAFLVKHFQEQGFTIGPEVAVVYEASTGGTLRSQTGTIVFPPKHVETLMPGELLWMFPKRDDHGRSIQQVELATLLQINKSRIVEFASYIKPSDLTNP